MKKQQKLALGILLGGVLVYFYLKSKNSEKKNYVSVKDNQFFTPEMGHFYKK